MPKTLAVTLSDAAIKRHIQDPSITQLRDPRYPVRVRFHACRERASWYVVRYAGGQLPGVDDPRPAGALA